MGLAADPDPRVYSFDGQTFRKLWTPEDVFGPTLRLTDTSFVIDHEIRAPPWILHDEYALTVNGPVKTN